LTGRRRFEVRFFERGVEAETLACGTGVVATAVAGAAAGELELPVTALTAGGFELTVDGDLEDGEARRLELQGDARVVARGELLPGASVVPARWRFDES
jgi:diaminopimelate epimerase